MFPVLCFIILFVKLCALLLPSLSLSPVSGKLCFIIHVGSAVIIVSVLGKHNIIVITYMNIYIFQPYIHS